VRAALVECKAYQSDKINQENAIKGLTFPNKMLKSYYVNMNRIEARDS